MSAHEYWTVALIIGLVAALIVATLLLLLIRSVGSIEKSVNGLLETAGRSPATPPTSPSSRRPPRCSG